jgi:hypothetical protein
LSGRLRRSRSSWGLSDYIGTEPLQMSERHFRRANEANTVLFCTSFFDSLEHVWK